MALHHNKGNPTQEEEENHLIRTTQLGEEKAISPLYVSKRDALIELIKRMTRGEGKTIEEAFGYIEELFEEHCALDAKGEAAQSKLSKEVPSIGKVFMPLKLRDALKEYDQKYLITSRKYVAPTFREIRHIFNTAQAHAIAQRVQLITFDADGTLYEDGGVLSENNVMNKIIIQFLQQKVYVAIVTAAGYPHQPERYTHRLQGLLSLLKQEQKEVRERFYVIGGECNYGFKVNDDGILYELSDDEWMSTAIKSWDPELIKALLDEAANVIATTAEKLAVSQKFRLIRKERAIGYIPVEGYRPRTEVVNELTFTVQHQVAKNIPYCAFTSEYQVWVDIGNKAYGVEALQSILNIPPETTLHIGDQLLLTGNDIAARMRASTLWITAPKETAFFCEMLLNDLQHRK